MTRDRPEHLERLLLSLERQILPPDEVVVVDNASVRSYADLRARFEGRLTLRWVEESRPGIPTARNTGIRAATGDVVLFTDDDCEAEPAWVERLVRPFYRNPHIGAVGGETLSARREGSLVEEFCIEESLLTMGRPDDGSDTIGDSVPAGEARQALPATAKERA